MMKRKVLEVSVRNEINVVREQLAELDKKNQARKGYDAHSSIELRFSREIEFKRIQANFLFQQLNDILLAKTSRSSARASWLAALSTTILAIFALLTYLHGIR